MPGHDDAKNGLHFLTVLTLFLAFQPFVTAAEPKQILMMAGKPSHGYGSHEHYAGLKLLQESIEASSDDVEVTLVRGWPEDDKLVEQADSIVIYCDGGGRHLAMNHRDTLKQKLAKGCGFACLHYAVEMVPGEPGRRHGRDAGRSLRDPLECQPALDR